MLRIKEVLKEKGVSIQELADMLNIGVKTVSRQINCNPSTPSVETLQKIAEALNVHITELFDQPQKDGVSISGFLKIDNQVHEIKSVEDLKDICISL